MVYWIYLKREGINELAGSTEKEVSRSQHRKIKEEVIKEVKGNGG